MHSVNESFFFFFKGKKSCVVGGKERVCFRISKLHSCPFSQHLRDSHTRQPQRREAKALTAADSSWSCPDNSHLGRVALGTCRKMLSCPPPMGLVGLDFPIYEGSGQLTGPNPKLWA